MPVARAMPVVAKVRAALADPVKTGYYIRGRMDADRLWERQAALARAAGIDRVYLVLSFDCDTVEDANVVWDVHSRLASLGVRPTYAVPGEVLARGADVYARIASTGAPFINHGFVEHTVLDRATGRYTSTFFYDRVPPERVRRDVVGGDTALRETLGVRPTGFRTPHFGTFQSRAQLRFLHEILEDLGYTYSSSTMPLYGLRFGPVFDDLGLRELPVSGMPSAPLQILDSWACFAAPDRTHVPADFAREAAALGDRLARLGAGVINVYADPSHVHGSEHFFGAVERWLEVAEPVTYDELLGAT